MKKIIKKLYKLIIFLLPKTRFCDKIIAYCNFIRCHQRLPNNKHMNDILFNIKTTDEILKLERQFTTCKELAKIYIKNIVGDDKNVPTKAILKSETEILNYKFTKNDVIKPTHASGLIKFVKDEPIDKKEIISWLKINYYEVDREANYKYLQPKIIVEEKIFGKINVDDIKFFCVNGKAKVVQLDFDRYSNHTRSLYNTNWINLNASTGYPLATKKVEKPLLFDEMIYVVEKLSKAFNFVRIDLYYDDILKKFYVGEITHCHGGANERFNSKAAEIRVSKELFS